VFDFLVFIGRFQPFHAGHQAVVRTALAQSRRVILLIGSAEQPRSTRNTFTFEEREQMVLTAFENSDAARIDCVPLIDVIYDDARWVKSVEDAVASVVTQHLHTIPTPKVGLVGHYKDPTSYYLSLFPHWDTVTVDSYRGISATPIRDAYLLGTLPLRDHIPQSTLDFLTRFQRSEVYPVLQEEARYIAEYKQSWRVAPYPPTFVTVDAAVVHDGHILLVERGNLPGRGLWALPGGFLDPEETLFAGCLRELREETQIALTDAMLRAAYRKQRTFDEPHRCERGRAITQGFYFELDASQPRPIVEGADDAKHAFWWPLDEIRSTQMFEDHYAIIDELTGHFH